MRAEGDSLDTIPDDEIRTICKPATEVTIAMIGLPPKGNRAAARIAEPETTRWTPEFDFSTENKQYITNAVQNGSAIAVSNRSHKEDWGTSAFIIEGGQHQEHRLSGTCTTPGHPEDQEAYRSKLSRIYCTINMIEDICERHNIKKAALQ